MAEIPLHARNGSIRAVAIVDDDDHAELSLHQWHMVSGYAVRRLATGGDVEYLHRRLLGMRPKDGRVADHVSRNRLDNRRSNLRELPSKTANMQNLGARSDSGNGLRGVFFDKQRSKWRGKVTVEGKTHKTGRFDDIESANSAVVELRSRLMPFAGGA